MVAVNCKASGTVANVLSSASTSPARAEIVITIDVPVMESAWQTARTHTFRRATPLLSAWAVGVTEPTLEIPDGLMMRPRAFLW